MGDRDSKISVSLDKDMIFRYKEIADGVYALQTAIWPLDDLVDAATTITYEHHEVHEGNMFSASRKSAEGADIADNGSLDMLLVTGANTAHLTFEVQAGGDCEVLFYESTVTSNDGTAIFEANMNRGALPIATTVATYTPTVAGGSEGTLLLNILVAGGTGGNAGGGTGAVRPGTEWILRASTKHLIRATNRAGSGKPISIVAQWYEE